MDHEQALKDIEDQLSIGCRENALDILRNHYAVGLADGKEIAGWKK
jgi:hypothetical protein